MPNHYEDELELLMLHNPKGGKPQPVGKMLFTMPGPARENVVEISQVKEDNSIRFHLGYCKCGLKIVAGEKRALILVKTLAKILGVHTEEEVDAKILKHVMSYPQNIENEA